MWMWVAAVGRWGVAVALFGLRTAVAWEVVERVLE